MVVKFFASVGASFSNAGHVENLPALLNNSRVSKVGASVFFFILF